MSKPKRKPSKPRPFWPGHEAVHEALEAAIAKLTQSGVARQAGVKPQEVYACRKGRGRVPYGKLLGSLGFELRYVRVGGQRSNPKIQARDAEAFALQLRANTGSNPENLPAESAPRVE